MLLKLKKCGFIKPLGLCVLTPFVLPGRIADLLIKCQFIPHLPPGVKEKFHKLIPYLGLLAFSLKFLGNYTGRPSAVLAAGAGRGQQGLVLGQRGLIFKFSGGINGKFLGVPEDHAVAFRQVRQVLVFQGFLLQAVP